jgi:hypothetical protein
MVQPKATDLKSSHYSIAKSAIIYVPYTTCQKKYTYHISWPNLANQMDGQIHAWHLTTHKLSIF